MILLIFMIIYAIFVICFIYEFLVISSVYHEGFNTYLVLIRGSKSKDYYRFRLF